ncbi:MAG: hypothetical protein IRY93_09285 [Chthoniobacterales bacterium]|nr:hypothetical protein [Chthoniobacterales bacterium]
MSDLSEIENELRKLRPVQPSPILLERVAEAIGGPDPQAAFAGRSSAAARVFRNWLSLGAGLAAAAILLLLTVMKMGDGKRFVKEVSSISPGRETERASAARSETESMAESTLRSRFLPAGATRVVYDARDEGLQFVAGSAQPLRRLRYQARQTLQWRDPATGASIRVSYPSEEVLLLPVSGQ